MSLFGPSQTTIARVNDSCACGAEFVSVGAGAGINHRYWMEAHAVCRAKRKAVVTTRCTCAGNEGVGDTNCPVHGVEAALSSHEGARND